MPAESVSFQPFLNYEQALTEACAIWGVQPDYWDIWGKHHVAPPDAQRAVLESLGVPAGSLEELNHAIGRKLLQDWAVVAPPTLVMSDSQRELLFSIPNCDVGQILRLEFLFEDGSSHSLEVNTSALLNNRSASVAGSQFVQKAVLLSQPLPLGYHTLRVRIRDRNCESRLAVAPDHAYAPAAIANGGRAAGVAISLYGLRSNRNWGCGDFTDLHAFTDWVSEELSASFVALNPLHAISNRQPYNTSPYLPNSTFYRNPLYLDIEAIEDFTNTREAADLMADAATEEEIEALRDSEHVEYERVYALKLRFLQILFRQFMNAEWQWNSGRAQQFRAYLESEGDLLHVFALYCALDEHIHQDNPSIWMWPDWPEEYKNPLSTEVAQFAAGHYQDVLFHKYIQWHVDLQLAAAQRHAKERGLSIGLYHDLALATDRCGSDLWAHRPFYVDGCRVGSPPDDFAPSGQDWAFPPPNSLRHRADAYRLFAESIRKNLKHGGALRIDHVMRFFRLFWIPDGKQALDGLYVRDNYEHLIRILALESVRNQVVVIGEDLGTVEPFIRETLQKFGVLSYRLLYFEKNSAGGFKKPDEYPAHALVSASTHDLPTLSGFWTSRDIEARHAAGLLPDELSYRQQLDQRRQEKQKLLNVFHELELLPVSYPKRAEEIPEFTGELHNAAVGFLVSTPSALMVLNQEDLFKAADQQNLPGSTHQYPNWRHKMRYSIEELRTDKAARGCAEMFRDWIERSGRANRQ